MERTSIAARLYRLEGLLAGLALLLMGVLPVLEIGLRILFKRGIPGSSGYVQHLTLWVGFLGAMLASREKKHLALSTGADRLSGGLKRATGHYTALCSTAVGAGLTWAAIGFVNAERQSPATIAEWLPVWCAEAVLPISFAVMTLRFVLAEKGWRDRALAALGIPLAIAIGFGAIPAGWPVRWPGIVLVLLAAVLGSPIFVALGGAAMLLLSTEDFAVPVAAIPVETYRIVVSPSIPTIPLFTLAGYVLAEGGASKRLVRLFQSLFGWMPGGLAIMATLVCAFFTTFTGASGVTILALGGLLLPALLGSGYRDRFSVGLLTATGSLGLLFPPSLPVILYAVMAKVPIPDLFKAAALPGLLLVTAVALYSVREGVRSKVAQQRFDLAETGRALWGAKWEVGLPIVALFGIFGGYTSLIEAAAITVVYALVTETIIHRDVSLRRDLPRVLEKCTTLIGGVFVILGVAMGLTNYLVDAMIPMQAADWVEAHVSSRILFLLALNLFLLIVGCLMDIFSAIVVVVPLILPISAVFAIDPLHLGVIFLANLELGYLTPPVGMNLFLSSYRFERPLGEVYRSAIPFLILLLGVVLLITYVPALTTWAGSVPALPGAAR